MMKQILGITAILLSLTGCATVGIMTPPPPGADSLTSAKINNSLSDNDRAQLAHLINTAKPTATVSSGSFTFTSYNIFINGQGQPCRTYSVTVSHIFGNKESKQVACRVNGNWVGSSS